MQGSVEVQLVLQVLVLQLLLDPLLETLTSTLKNRFSAVSTAIVASKVAFCSVSFAVHAENKQSV